MAIKGFCSKGLRPLPSAGPPEAKKRSKGLEAKTIKISKKSSDNAKIALTQPNRAVESCLFFLA
ncbi:MAG: hypothetical protein BWX66_01053 [Deltaproteobacteria bacterium ADurb.Bin058]|nr:MAG: hypothetical protein BWX66_01053 [Deltaproteobacteria bacterium ADurb.Bin058]